MSRERTTRWQTPRRVSLTCRTGSFFLTSAHTFSRASLGVCPPLPSNYKRQLTIMLLNKQSLRVSMPPSSSKTPPPGANGGTPAAGCKSPPTSRTLRTPLPSSNFLRSASVPDFYSRKGNLSRTNQSSNTSTRSVKSLHPWGPTTPDTTEWGSSAFAWYPRWRPTRKRILLKQECGPYLSVLYKPWTPPPREPNQ